MMKMAGEGRSLRSVLIVEDSVAALAMSSHLESLGCEVVTAQNGQAALRATQDHHFDIGIIDYRLRGGMLGTELAARLRETQQGIRIVLISGYPRDHLHTDEVFLQKPFGLDEITGVIDELDD